ncbi:MAG: DNA-processing protein DprA [Flavobacteriaceae bacterium]
MSINEHIAALRLQSIPQIGNITAKKLVAHCGSPSAVFSDKKKALLSIEGIGEYTLKGLFDTRYLDAALEEYNFVKRSGIGMWIFTEADFPKNLNHCPDGPILLFSKGRIRLQQQKIISVVGTRNMTERGRSFCERFIEDIAALNPIIVSGFALGVDICVQRAAIKHGLQTIGCLAHGLNQIYPRTHAPFMKPVMDNGGFLSEFWSTSRPERENFLRRNRIIAGLSQATVVVESAEKGGSLVTADLAAGYNRDVFAVPGRPGDLYSEGCNNLIKQQKAQLLTSAADLVYMLNWNLEPVKSRPVQKRLFVELQDSEKTIYEFLLVDGKQQLDSIAVNCDLPIFKVSSTLLEMEMKGIVRCLPGKVFEAV